MNAPEPDAKNALIFQCFDPAPFQFPRPKVPLLATPSWSMLNLNPSPRPTSLGHEQIHFTRGRYALFEAYRLAGVCPTRGVLAPAYHCRTMLDPAMALHAPIGLYPLSADLQPDLVELSRLLTSSVHPVAAVLLTHYFGIAQPAATVDAIGALCAAHGAILIEDCSHVCVEAAASSSMGRTGDLGVSSPYKFFPSGDGGLLWRNRTLNPSTPALQAPIAQPWLMQARAWARLARDLVRGDKLSLLPPLAAPAVTGSSAEEQQSADALTSETQPSPLYNAADAGIQSSAASRWVAQHTDLDAMAQARRANFQQWLAATADLPHCSPLVSALPPHAVPYMFALRIDHPASHFTALKRLGLPIWRWDEMAVSACRTATDYRLHLLHLPCHQQLSIAQMNWMIEGLTWVLKNVSVEESVHATA